MQRLTLMRDQLTPWFVLSNGQKKQVQEDMDWFFFEEQHPTTTQLLVFVGDIKF
jgi:aminopeptidase N